MGAVNKIILAINFGLHHCNLIPDMAVLNGNRELSHMVANANAFPRAGYSDVFPAEKVLGPHKKTYGAISLYVGRVILLVYENSKAFSGASFFFNDKLGNK